MIVYTVFTFSICAFYLYFASSEHCPSINSDDGISAKYKNIVDYVEDDSFLQCKQYDGEHLRKELDEKGYVVIPNVVPLGECDKYIVQYRQWLDRFGEGNRPGWSRSLIHHYKLTHYEPSWKVRLWAKPVFAAVWKTDKLLSSWDGVAIGEPPELGKTKFRELDSNWFHLDQGSWRDGVHAYQGTVYLEKVSEDDLCFRVIERSNNFHTKFYTEFPKAAEGAAGSDFYRLNSEYIDWYKQHGCTEKLVPVPKGGMVLWDSRTIHDNVNPLKGRQHPDRWRFVVLVSMTPAIWATDEDLNLKRKAYNELLTTAHWSSQGVWLFPNTSEAIATKDTLHNEAVDELPDIAKTTTVKRLAGMELYDFEDGKSNGPGWSPKWNVDKHVISSRDLSDDLN